MVQRRAQRNSSEKSLTDDGIKVMAMIQSIFERGGIIPEELLYETSAKEYSSERERVDTSPSSKGHSDPELLERIQRLEAVLLRMDPKKLIQQLSAERHASSKATRGMIDIVVQRDFSPVENIELIIVDESEEGVIYHIFVKEGYVGTLIRILTVKYLSIQDFFSDIQIDFRIYDIRDLKSLKFQNPEVVIENEGAFRNDQGSTS